MQRPVIIRRQAATCQAFGPAQTLISRLERGEMHLISAVSSLMILQWTTLGWPSPDQIIPLPVSWWTRSKTGGDVNALLAQKLAQALNVPLLNPLSLAWDTRAMLNGEEPSFKLQTNKKQAICEKTVLLLSLKLDDNRLRQAAEALQEGFPSSISAFAFSIY